uniref:acyltransferase family protein n=1 Tax=Rosenbergiella collisarenosi TaxID=1544695 RepID=UPI003BA8F921
MIYSIQYLRLIACLMVVILHISLKNHLSNGNDFLYFGASGVDIFFIISGYIMCHINSKKPTTPIKFIKDRILRIYP